MGYKLKKNGEANVINAVRNGNTKKPVVTRHCVSFHRPNTLKHVRRPIYLRSLKSGRCKLDHYSIIKYPLASETAIKKIEKHNTLTFIVDSRAGKKRIKNAVNKLYNIQVNKINTLFRPDGYKKAYIKLKADSCALNLAD